MLYQSGLYQPNKGGFLAAKLQKKGFKHLKNSKHQSGFPVHFDQDGSENPDEYDNYPTENCLPMTTTASASNFIQYQEQPI